MASDSEIDETMRLQYLQAMGIDVWAPRQEQAPIQHDAEPVIVEQENTETPVVGQENTETGIIDLESVEAVESPVVTEVADNWDSFQAQVAECRRCRLCETRTQTVFGSGNRQADWMLIGEAPGQSEDQQGLPFVGKAGQLLTEMIRALGLNREQVYIANVLKCRPPNNRDPKAEEVEACSEYLQRQIALVQPKIILAVGRIAAQNLLHTQAPLGKLRTTVHKLDNIPLIVIYHPAYLLRSPLEKRKAWEDLQFAMKTVETLKK